MSHAAAEAFRARMIKAGAAVAPATEEQIADAEREIGQALPDDVRALFRTTNGISGAVFDDAYRLFDLDGLVQYWKLSMELGAGDAKDAEYTGLDGAKGAYFLPGWFPVLDRGDSSFLAYDDDPDSDGQRGQLVYVDPQDGDREVQSPSLWAWLSDIPVEVHSEE